MTVERPPVEKLRGGEYIKSSFSPDKGDCVRLSRVEGWIGMQDEKEYDTIPATQRTTLGYTVAEFAAFLKGAKAGEFDHLIL
ncbi:hypothetical protein BS329_15490 [Amycolatopsis coloradensis]|uniref:DUF397 domain-containing protein n=1 Tax=Amycolatopsis coloradensis TaxID=76021 RepID=A0A1R0KUE9_9PSEU|nr:DUF397 domain-containing protein [Amycolatopsis coloradensis]OLZ51752.1 hypothetical protein BS329_15490 [Amycolatopsis coloradensis]